VTLPARALGLAALLIGAAMVATAQEASDAGPAVTIGRDAIVRGLDKVTGQLVDFTLENGQSARLGRLTIEAGECRYPSDDPASDAYAWLTVLDDSAATPVFQGWMIAAAPALSALDHPRYDVWLVRCDIADS
jgi:hypothetical protein